MTDLDFPIPDVPASNARHDHEHGDPFGLATIRSAWRESHLMRRGKLTDKTIAKYEKLGFYSAEFRDARRALQERKAKKRSGHFLIADDGRLIYDLK